MAKKVAKGAATDISAAEKLKALYNLQKIDSTLDEVRRLDRPQLRGADLRDGL